MSYSKIIYNLANNSNHNSLLASPWTDFLKSNLNNCAVIHFPLSN